MSASSPLTPQRERMAEAVAIERLHGDGAPAFIAGRIGALALAGDVAGVDRWKSIAAALQSIRGGAGALN